METPEKQLLALLGIENKDALGKKAKTFEAFLDSELIQCMLHDIATKTQNLKDSWKLTARINDILSQQLLLTNGTVGKPYTHKINFFQHGLNDLVRVDINGLEAIGLSYDHGTETISGTPTQSGDTQIALHFLLQAQPEDAELNIKKMMLIINPDPRSLWKTLESDQSAPFWKPDQAFEVGTFLDKRILAISKRGRSHANVGSFRDDDFAFKSFENGWHVATLADGAGSAKISREGSRVACQEVLSLFKNTKPGLLTELEAHVTSMQIEKTEELTRSLNVCIYELLSGIAKGVHNALLETAVKAEAELKDLHSTLVFLLAKKFDFGYVMLHFSVGDCPIALVETGEEASHLLNKLDVGEYGGGTRFITMPEIFTSDKYTSRLGFKQITDFSHLFLMTDGIYDPKFGVEAQLLNIAAWKEFLADLRGNNESKTAINFSEQSTEVLEQQSFDWMDFWSPGNHDDRTLLIITSV
jgi:Protein phosphatase 2C